MLMAEWNHLRGWHSPHFEVVRPHEEVGDPSSHHPHDPLVEVLGLARCHACLESGVDHTIHALHLLFLGQHGNVVLEWIWHPEILAANVGNPLVCVPIILLRKSFVDAVVEVFVVRENDMTTDVIELTIGQQE